MESFNPSAEELGDLLKKYGHSLIIARELGIRLSVVLRAMHRLKFPTPLWYNKAVQLVIRELREETPSIEATTIAQATGLSKTRVQRQLQIVKAAEPPAAPGAAETPAPVETHTDEGTTLDLRNYQLPNE